MLIITVEIAPYGDLSRRRTLGVATIANDGTGTHTSGNYRIRLSQNGRPRRAWKTGVVHGFPRTRYGIWDLLYAALDDVVGTRLHRWRKS